MRSSIWTECAGGSELRPLRLLPWRVVEAQHQLSTRKLVDSAAEQELLESLIDGAKPPALPPARGARPFHYLLTTPFRYPPLRNGSRFGGRFERGIWYGADALRTAFAEVAYYRFVFRAGSTADLGVLATSLTVFRARVRTDRGIDLLAPPFDACREVIASPTSYGEAQALGSAMRSEGVEAFRYPSARLPEREAAACVAVLDPAAFTGARPRDIGTWQCTATPERVEFAMRDYFRRDVVTFERAAFLVAGRLPVPAL
jgi:hypothetical protein